MYLDGLGELVGVDQDNVVTVRLKPNKRWNDSYQITAKDDQYTIAKSRDHLFAAADLSVTRSSDVDIRHSRRWPPPTGAA